MTGPTLVTGFAARVDLARVRHESSLCIGLDPEPGLLPDHLDGVEGMRSFCLAIVEATADLACAFKPNLAFFERFGAEGWRVLESLLAAIPHDVPVIADAKRGDIGSTSTAYAEALYERLGAAAVTVNPYLGVDAIAPLLDHPRGFAFVLCRTSNPGAGALQDLLVAGEPLYSHVLRLFQPWLQSGRAGLVIGAGEAAAFGWAARLAPGAVMLVPGIGAQGGSVAALAGALSAEQTSRVVVNVSRAIIHTGRDRDFARAARQAALGYRRSLQDALAQRVLAAPDPDEVPS